MSEEKIIIDADILRGYHAEGMAIICAPTGIICTVQAGGAICEQPETEGYRIPIWMNDPKLFYKTLEEFDDCGWGDNINLKGWDDDEIELEKDNIKENKINYAEAINEFLKKSVNGENLENIQFSFDYERIEEVMEGWWPVLVQFYHYKYHHYEQKFKGYLHFGNCD